MNNIERRIASAYHGLEPSASVEDAIRRGLSAERARPARHGPLAVVLAVAAVLAMGAALMRMPRPTEGLADEGEGTPKPAVVARPPSGVVADDGDRIRVRLTNDGRILVPGKLQADEWRRLTLAELAEHLEREAKAFDERETEAGRSGYEEIPGGAKASRLSVELLADRDAPWRHVQWIMLVCAEQSMPRVAFAVQSPESSAFRLDAGLPVDRGLDREPDVRVRVAVRVGERVRYRFGDQESEELASVARYLVDAREAAESAKASLRGEIRADRGAPFQEVAKLLAEFRQAGYEHVDFYGPPVPDAETRQATKLPAQESDSGR